MGNHLWNLPSQHRGLIRKIIVTTEYACLAIALVSILFTDSKNRVREWIADTLSLINTPDALTFSFCVHVYGLCILGIVQVTAVRAVFPNKASVERFTKEVFNKKTYIFSIAWFRCCAMSELPKA